MKMKQIYMFAGMFLFLLMCIGIASAATTMNVPVTGTNYTTLTFNCTTTTAECDECLNASIYYDAAGGATTTYLGAVVNGSADDVDFTGLISIEALDDLLTYNFTCRMFNATGNVVNSTSVEDVGIDNTAPVISVDRAGTAYIDYMTSVSISCSATDATTSVTSTTRTLTKPSTETVVVTDTPHTFTGGDLNELGKYTFTCAAVDNPGNTNSDTVEFTVQTEDDVIVDGEDDIQRAAGISGMLLFLLIFGAAAVIIIFIIIIASKQK